MVLTSDSDCLYCRRIWSVWTFSDWISKYFKWSEL